MTIASECYDGSGCPSGSGRPSPAAEGEKAAAGVMNEPLASFKSSLGAVSIQVALQTVLNGSAVDQVFSFNAVYVNNHKIEKIDLDRIKLLSATESSTESTKADLVTKENFTNPVQYYQYLVGSDPAGHVDLLWGKNKTYLPSIFRSSTTQEPPPAPTIISYADDLSPVQNTLNNTTPFFKGDYYVDPVEIFSTTTTSRPVKQIKKPKTKPEPAKKQTKLTKETLELLRKYFSFNCSLTPIQTSTTPLPKTGTKKLRNRGKSKTPTTVRPPEVNNKLARPAKGKKPYRPVVYVYPPVISSLGGVLESVYNYMHDAFIDTEYISVEDTDEQRTVKKVLKSNDRKKTKRDSRNSGGVESSTATAATISSKQYHQPDVKRVTSSGLPGEGTTKNKLTTNIHVTSEYTPATPGTLPILSPGAFDEKDQSSEESGSEEDDGGDYYEGFAANDSYEDDADDDDDGDDDESQEGEESDEYGASEEATGNQVANDKDYDYEDDSDKVAGPVKVKRQKQPVSAEEYSEEDSDDYDSEEDSDDGGDGEGFFSGIFASLGRIVRSLGFGPRTTVEYSDYDETRSTTPKVIDLRKRPTRSTDQDTQTQLERVHEVTDKQQPWYHYPSYLFNEVEEEPVIQTPVETNLVTENDSTNNWFQLMMPWDFFNPWSSWDEEPATVTNQNQPAMVVTVPPTTAPATEPDSGWFPNLFGNMATTERPSTKPVPPKPLIPFLPASDPLQKPETWLSVIAQHVFTTTRTPKTTKFPSTTHLTKPTKVYYSGYQLWRLFPRSTENVRSLEDYRVSPEGVKLQWWKGPTLRGSNDILVPPGMLDRMTEYLRDEDIPREVMIRDLGQAILYENPKMTRREQIETEVLHGHPLTWYRYHRYGDIVKFMNYLGRKYPRNVELIHVGRSFEARPLTVVKVKFDGKRSIGGKVHNSKYMKGKRRYSGKKKGPRSAVFIEAGAHGREWIGPAVATWILDALTKAIANNDTELENIKAMDWYVLSVLNPDGYEYSQDYDRMWRKTRSKHREIQSSGIITSALSWLQSHSSLSMNSDQSCYGADLDRNWDHRWNEAGASKSACSEFYAGQSAFSEPEARALSKFLTKGRRNIQIYLSLQSYGQTISYPDGKRLQGEDRFSDVHEMATVAVEALRGSGSHVSYRVDSEDEMAHPRSGTSTQFARYEAGIKYSYTVELPDTGTHGFLLPPSGIEATARDTLELIKGMVDYV
ncbi:uncharacterized protein LOC131676172 [Topomyia yanbarensis]|uniref:uncharacterized protein LOC131676172 n=1 Tax=Topomyia yanbarensis TaxID=2498891 RepID=UPI00273C932A|nr:uncharacterized protein LOC131676172 [Topomyia yanbarensis]